VVEDIWIGLTYSRNLTEKPGAVKNYFFGACDARFGAKRRAKKI
jgi:hypothetical protein